MNQLKRVFPLKYMLLIFIAAICLRVSITSIGPVLEVVVAELKLSRAMASLIVTIPVACMGVCALLAQPLSVRFGLERTIAGCLLLTAFATFIRTGNHSIYLLGLGSMLVGTSIAIAGPLISGFVKRYSGVHISKGMMLYSLGISLSGMLGTFITLPLMRYAGLSWASALQFWALPIAIIGVVWALVFMRKQSSRIGEVSVRLPWTNRRAWALLISFGLQSGTFYSLLAWLMPYLREFHFSETQANHFLNLYMLMAPIGSICFPLLLAKCDRQWVIFSCGFGTMIALLWLAIDPHFATFFAISLVGITAGGGMFILILSLPFYEVDNANEVASWTAMILSIGYLISAIIPTIFGFLKDITGSYHGVMWGLFGVSTMMTVLLWYLTIRRAQ